MTSPATAGRPRAWLTTHATPASVAVLALISYLPALLSSPGRMPADTKLYLYLDPGGLLARSPSTFEPDQFAGWVPHQQITYLWPSGPWFWLFDTAGVPDWVAHRLWIATIMFAAGSGVLWMSRRLGLASAAALAAALTYQLSPYLLPYISRTSLLLLPWAGLGWIVGLTITATARAPSGRAGGDGDPSGGRWRRQVLRWREPALIALVVATVGSVNATALVLIAPAPVLWLVHAAWAGRVSWREATSFALRTAAACVAVSLWWIAMLVVQARNGAPVLAYSETLTDVSRNSTGSEVLRSLGYWLFYVRDPYGPGTTASLDYLTRTPTMAISFAVTLVGLAGIALTTSVSRRFAGLLVVTGMVLAVGVHPIGSPSPLMSLFATDDESGLALALRSSTRALPMLVLGLALGVASLVAAIPADRLTAGRPSLPRLRSVAALGAALLVAANLATLWRFELVDPVLERDESPPAAWIDAAAALDAGADGGRVLQLPGAEFGAFRWGYTVDQPLVGLAERDLVTRDLLPLGSAGAMDLLYALDDRVQEGTIEPAAIAPVARLLGADTVWVANDAEYERFRTPRPEVAASRLTADVPSAARQPYGELFVVEPTVPMVDPTALSDPRVGTPLAPVVLVDVDGAPGVVRAKDEVVIVSGSGDGVVDAAAAGLLTGHELIRYSASLSADELAAELAAGTPLIVTDSNRDRARHWRTSQDVHGHTEPGGPDDDVLARTNADQRLAVFETDDAATQTVAVQEGPLTAVASAYGEPFAYLPEHRAVAAIDGQPATAWLVGGHGDPVGEEICVTHDDDADAVVLAQPDRHPDRRRIDAVRIHRAEGPAVDLALTERSATASGERFAVDLPAGGFCAEIASVTTGTPGTAASREAVGFTAIELDVGPTTEMIRPPVDGLGAVGADTPLAVVLSRLRVDPLDRWRADPEWELARLVELPGERTVEADVTVRLDRRATDDVIAELTGRRTVTSASARLTGAARHGGRAAFDGDPATAWITPIDGAVGASLRLLGSGPVGPELVLLQPTGDFSPITGLRVGDDLDSFEVAVPPPDPDGVSAVRLPASLGSGDVTISITDIDARFTVDRRFGDVVTLPAAVADLRGPGLPTPRPDDDEPFARTCTDDLLTLDGEPVPLSFETTIGELLDGAPIQASVCDGPLVLDAGEHRIVSTGRPTGLTVDRVVLTDAPTEPAAPAAAVTVLRDDPRHRTVRVEDCPDGCWLVFGEGFNTAWSARTEAGSLGEPEMVDGGFNGWRIPAATGPVVVDITWTAQWPVTVGLALSVLGIVACLVVVGLTARRRAPALDAVEPSFGWRRPGSIRPWSQAAVLAAATTLLVSPLAGLAALVVGIVAAVLVVRVAHPLAARALELVGWAGAALVAVGAIVINRRNSPPPDAGWTVSFEQLNQLALFSVMCIAVGALGWTSTRRSP